jgi:nucleoid-associated protein EbfC
MFGKLGDMMGKLQEMKRMAEEIKKKLDETTVNYVHGGGEITIAISGTRKVRSLSISDTLAKGPKDKLEHELVAALNKAVEEADKVNESEMKKIAGGLLPGLGI